MSVEVPNCRVEAHLTVAPPTARLAATPGVSHVTVSGSTFRCIVAGSIQPLLECLRGYEVIQLLSLPVDDDG